MNLTKSQLTYLKQIISNTHGVIHDHTKKRLLGNFPSSLTCHDLKLSYQIVSECLNDDVMGIDTNDLMRAKRLLNRLKIITGGNNDS